MYIDLPISIFLSRRPYTHEPLQQLCMHPRSRQGHRERVRGGSASAQCHSLHGSKGEAHEIRDHLRMRFSFRRFRCLCRFILRARFRRTLSSRNSCTCRTTPPSAGAHRPPPGTTGRCCHCCCCTTRPPLLHAPPSWLRHTGCRAAAAAVAATVAELAETHVVRPAGAGCRTERGVVEARGAAGGSGSSGCGRSDGRRRAAAAAVAAVAAAGSAPVSLAPVGR